MCRIRKASTKPHKRGKRDFVIICPTFRDLLTADLSRMIPLQICSLFFDILIIIYDYYR